MEVFHTMSNVKKTRFLALSAVIAGLYAALTYAAAALNLAYGPIQFRFSEALTVLPAFLIGNFINPVFHCHIFAHDNFDIVI